MNLSAKPSYVSFINNSENSVRLSLYSFEKLFGTGQSPKDCRNLSQDSWCPYTIEEWV